jgi:hypothetical protein
VHSVARFAHELYYQRRGGRPAASQPDAGIPASRPIESCMDLAKTHGLVDQKDPLFMQSLYGELPNQDTWVS